MMLPKVAEPDGVFMTALAVDVVKRSFLWSKT
jgi:hypothetical protein